MIFHDDPESYEAYLKIHADRIVRLVSAGVPLQVLHEDRWIDINPGEKPRPECEYRIEPMFMKGLRLGLRLNRWESEESATIQDSRSIGVMEKYGI